MPRVSANAGFSDRLYRTVIGRAADAQGFAFWAGQMGAPTDVTRGQVLLQCANSAACRRAIDADVAVARLYVTVLRRQPDDVGLAFSAKRLERGDSIPKLISEFITANEYRGRFLDSFITLDLFADPPLA